DAFEIELRGWRADAERTKTAPPADAEHGDCRRCGGTGEFLKHGPCFTCNGSGRYPGKQAARAEYQSRRADRATIEAVRAAAYRDGRRRAMEAAKAEALRSGRTVAV
ncbi:MAG: hypothetical protein Q4G62_07140, partial [Pseudomonadota bacterium]|nr:hypothetical protein [Pseudomonadota bacterium]